MNLIKDKKRLKRICNKSLKIAIGSGLAIILANLLNLKYDIFAGTITLLTILTTKWETIRLSLYRMSITSSMEIRKFLNCATRLCAAISIIC